jgi:hypothetical protein
MDYTCSIPIFSDQIMRLINEKNIRSVGSLLLLVEGDTPEGRVLGLGFADHPVLLVSKNAVAQGPALREAEENEDDNDTPEFVALQAALYQVENDLSKNLDPVPAYQFVSSCIEDGYDIVRDGANIAYWLIEMLQKSAKNQSQ